jgi:hypothetical protein
MFGTQLFHVNSSCTTESAAAMELLCTLIIVLVCLGTPTAYIKTITSGIWIVTLFVHFALEPDALKRLWIVLKWLFQNDNGAEE